MASQQPAAVAGWTLDTLGPSINTAVFAHRTADAVLEAAEESRALVDAMLEGNALELLSARLPSFNETIEEEAAAVHNCLEVFENMIEVSSMIGPTWDSSCT